MATPPPSPPQTAPESSSTFGNIPGYVWVLIAIVVLLPALFFIGMFSAMFGFGGGPWMHGPDFDPDFPWFFPLFGFGFAGIMWIVSALLAIWVYKDAESRNMEGILWAIVVFFATIVGLIIYLVLRNNPPRALLKSPPPQPAPAAGNPASPFWSTPQAGGPLAPAATTGGGACPQCGTPLPAGARFCSSCGTRVG